jgi:HAD superfamily phosphoserine phosphatase-like hydrolase
VSARPTGLVAFDLDGTLLRGPTVCELLATAIGREGEARAFEAATTQSEVAAGRASKPALLSALASARWAPGVVPAMERLRRHGIEVAIASLTWRFAVSWFAERLGVRWYLGTDLRDDGAVAHVWPEDKGRWLQGLASELSVPAERVAAVGDSSGDVALLGAASLRVFVGAALPAGLAGARHCPHEDVDVIAERIVAAWTA